MGHSRSTSRAVQCATTVYADAFLGAGSIAWVHSAPVVVVVFGVVVIAVVMSVVVMVMIAVMIAVVLVHHVSAVRIPLSPATGAKQAKCRHEQGGQ